ncbi:MAG: YjjG family noncanonical pyrimidine nucleotidase [Bacteroidales bacterium]
MQYESVFFDLDRTLWDFEANARDTFIEMYEKHNLRVIFPDFDSFHEAYRKINKKLWEEYRNGNIEKEVLKYKRFQLTLEEFGYQDETLAKELGEDYVSLSANKTKLFPDTHSTLAYLKNRYNLYIITNGFHEVQFKKIRNCRLENYFQKIITSEQVGVQKPHVDIFHFALKEANTKAGKSIMIGDDLEGDIKGAKSAGIDQVFFNPNYQSHHEDSTYEIHALRELQKIL